MTDDDLAALVQSYRGLNVRIRATGETATITDVRHGPVGLEVRLFVYVADINAARRDEWRHKDEIEMLPPRRF